MIEDTAVPPTYYRVVEDKKISWMGSMTNLAAGTRIDPRGYGGAEGVAKLQAQGVKLRACWD